MTDETAFEGGVPMTPEGLVAAHPNAIWTCSDTMVEPLDMKPEMVTLGDVAYALSNQPRFTGHVKRTDGFPITVAQHSCNVARLVLRKTGDVREAMYGLLHDATEAYLSDMARPIKHYNEFGDAYRKVEDGLMVAVAAKFGLDGEMPASVKWADDVALRVECRDFMGPTMRAMYADGNEDVETYFPSTMRAWSHDAAEAEFLACFKLLDAILSGKWDNLVTVGVVTAGGVLVEPAADARLREEAERV